MRSGITACERLTFLS